MGMCICNQKTESSEITLNDITNNKIGININKIINSISHDENRSRKTNCTDSDKQRSGSNEKVYNENLYLYIQNFSNNKKIEKKKQKQFIEKVIIHEKGNTLLNVVVCGDSGVGKSSIVIRYTENEFDKFHIVSISLERAIKEIKVSNRIFTLNFIVTPGNPKYMSDYSDYYNQADCILFIIDFSLKSSFESMVNFRSQLIENKNRSLHYFVCNKSDLKLREIVKEYKDYVDKNEINYFEVSAKNNSNINKMFLNICEKFSEKVL